MPQSINKISNQTPENDDKQIPEITEKQLSFLSREMLDTPDTSSRQNLLDQVFTPKRQQEMIKNASRDSKGRPVRYYRYTSINNFSKLLRDCEQNHYTNYHHPEDFDREPDLAELKYLLTRYADFSKNEDLSDEISDLDKFSKEDFLQFVQALLPGHLTKTQLNDLSDNFTLRHTIDFLHRHFDHEFLMHNVTGGHILKKFSPYLSLSVGGIISDRVNPAEVYLEMIIPDDQIQISGNAFADNTFSGEKEVFTRQIKLDWISRVYADNDALYQDIITNPATQIGQYYDRKKTGLDAVEDWRWGEKTSDCLPVDVVRNYRKNKSKK